MEVLPSHMNGFLKPQVSQENLLAVLFSTTLSGSSVRVHFQGVRDGFTDTDTDTRAADGPNTSSI